MISEKNEKKNEEASTSTTDKKPLPSRDEHDGRQQRARRETAGKARLSSEKNGRGTGERGEGLEHDEQTKLLGATDGSGGGGG
ncbi:uncharacterized protein DS421_11g340020 [Arachis hypogaea]|nr:uncharacterized protein DS421_11g340020 [Arachis hypogaea]